MNCQQCGAVVPVDAKFCTQCSSPVTQVPEDIAKRARAQGIHEKGGWLVPEENSIYNDLFFRSTVDSYIKNKRFLRRDWLAEEVEERLREPASRFLLVTAEPGAGKSTFVAQLAHDHPDWLVYFIRRDQRTPLGDVGTRSFLLRLGYQLAAVYPDLFTQENIEIAVEQRIGTVDESGDVIGAEIKKFLVSPFYTNVVKIKQHIRRHKGKVVGLKVNELVVDPSLLDLNDLQNMALVDPALALRNQDPAKTIVILVDALDELRHHSGGETILRWLTNAPQLPPNLRFILTSRPPDRALQNFIVRQKPSLECLAIKADNKNIRADTWKYVRGLVKRKEVVSILSEQEGGIEAFSEKAVEKADGNLGYLDAIGRSIDHAIEHREHKTLKTLLTLQELPEKIEGLYAFFLHQLMAAVQEESVEVEDLESGEIRYLKAWSSMYRRALGVLAVALEPLSLLQIRTLGGIGAEEGYMTEALDRLRQFLDVVDNRYRLYHATVAEFLTADSTRVQNEIADLYLDPIRFHKQIADHYWNLFRQEWSRLDRYGLDNLAAHLAACGNTERLHQLISQIWMQARYETSGYTYNGFLEDIDLAWRAVSGLEKANLITQTRLQAARQIVGKRIDVYTDTDFEILIRLGRAEEALAHAALRANPREKCEGLLTLYSTLVDIGRPNPILLDEALQVAENIVNDKYRASTLCGLGVALSEVSDDRALEVLAVAESAARKVGGRSAFIEALNEVANAHIDAGETERAIVLLKEISDFLHAHPNRMLISDPSYALYRLAKAFRRLSLYDDALRITRSIPEMDTRASLLRDLAVELHRAGDHRADTVFTEAINAARACITLRANSLRMLAVALLKVGHEKSNEMIEEALAATRADPFLPGKELPYVALALAEAGSSRVSSLFDEAWQAARSKDEPYWELGSLASTMAQADDPRAQTVLDEAWAAAQTFESDFSRDQAGSDLARKLLGVGLLDKAEEVARSIPNTVPKASVLKELALAQAKVGDYQAAAALFDEAHALLNAIFDVEQHANTLRKLAVALAQIGDERARLVFEKAHHATRYMEIDMDKAQALRHLAEALAEAGYGEWARSVAREIESQREHVNVLYWDIHQRQHIKALCAMAVTLRQTARGQGVALLKEALEMARSLRSLDSQALGLEEVALAFHLVGDRRADAAFGEAWSAVQAIRDKATEAGQFRHLAAALAQAGRFHEAKMACDAIQEHHLQVRALSDLGVGLAKVGNSQYEAIFHKAEEIANILPTAFLQQNSLSGAREARAYALSLVGRYEDAVTAAHTIPQISEKASALNRVARVLIPTDHERARKIIEEAHNIARTIPNEYTRASVLCELADSLAQAGLLSEAFVTLGQRDLDQFIGALASWASYIERLYPGFALRVLQEIISVVGWVRPDWREIHELFST